MRDLIRLQTAIQQTMVSIAYMNSSNIFDGRPETIDNDVDVAFGAIANCFPDFTCIEDTVTRRLAKSEIYDTIRPLDNWRKIDPKYNVLAHIKSNITAGSVMEDIINMNSDEVEDEEIDLDFDTVKIS